MKQKRKVKRKPTKVACSYGIEETFVRMVTAILLIDAAPSRAEGYRPSDGSATEGRPGLPLCPALRPISNSEDDVLCIDNWVHYLATYKQVTRVYIATNAVWFKAVERWAWAGTSPAISIVNTGLTVGTGVEAVGLCIRRARADAAESKADAVSQDDAYLVIAADIIPSPALPLEALLEAIATGRADAAVFGLPVTNEAPIRLGLGVDKCILRHEKPADEDGATTVPHVYCLSSVQATRVAAVDEAAPLENLLGMCTADVSKLHMESLARRFVVGGNGTASLMGALVEYETHIGQPGPAWLQPPLLPTKVNPATVIHRTAYARVGLMGNPSDGFEGCTLGCTVRNFWAEAWMWPSHSVHLVPNALCDSHEFHDVHQLVRTITKDGYSGGRDLLAATIKRFVKHVTSLGMELPTTAFGMTFHTNIPRQVGLAGSSAIITAVFKCLLAFYGFESCPEKIGLPLELQPTFVLQVEEEELGVRAGLQDRVLQVYGGCVYMDFNGSHLREKGHGIYTRLPVSCLPPVFLAYAPEPKNSGKVHAPVRQRWANGEPEVLDKMAQIAALATAMRDRLVSRTSDAAPVDVTDLMNRNFALRRELYGDACVGPTNLSLAATAASVGAAAKLPGSGGAALVAFKLESVLATVGRDSGSWEDAVHIVRQAFEAKGFVFVKLDFVEP